MTDDDNSNTLGVGTLVGMDWGQHLNDVDYMRHSMVLATQQAEVDMSQVGAVAAKDAGKALLNAVIGELLAESQGKLTHRRLSDPANAALRASAFADTVAGQIQRATGGRCQMRASLKERFIEAGRHGREMSSQLSESMNLSAEPAKK